MDDLEQICSDDGNRTQNNKNLKSLINKGFQLDCGNEPSQTSKIDKQVNFDDAQFQKMIHVFD